MRKMMTWALGLTLLFNGTAMAQMTLRQEQQFAAQKAIEAMKLLGFCSGYFDISTKAAEALELGGSVSREEARRFLTALPFSIMQATSQLGQIYLAMKLTGLGTTIDESQVVDLVAQAKKEGARAGDRDIEQSVVFQHYKECSAAFSPAPPPGTISPQEAEKRTEKIVADAAARCAADFRARPDASAKFAAFAKMSGSTRLGVIANGDFITFPVQKTSDGNAYMHQLIANACYNLLVPYMPAEPTNAEVMIYNMQKNNNIDNILKGK
jgi:hypothetical protein